MGLGMRYYLLIFLFIIQSPLLSQVNSRTNYMNSVQKNKIEKANFVTIKKDLLNKLQYRYKDPFIAGLLSVPMWGVGQFYAGEYTKGSLFVFGDLVYKGMLLGLIIKLNNNYTSKVNGDNEVDWSELSSNDRFLVVGYVVSYLVISAWSVADAAYSANKFNDRNSLKNKFKLSLEPDYHNSLVVKFGLNLSF